MTSWFSNIIPTEALEKVRQLSSQVQEKLPLDDEFIKKLTLRSDDLQQEHDLIDAQETRKELVRDYLANILPWETKDEARVILVDECRESIEKMSAEGETFTGPFELPDTVERMFSENSGMIEATEETRTDASKKLEKMGKLPELLDEFDIYAHVGLIERLFKLDKNLARSHSLLESAGKSELIFWKNYFFHCAYIRYTVGLSVEEIWSVTTEPITSDKDKSLSESSHNGDDDNQSVELTFAAENDDSIHSSHLDNTEDDAKSSVEHDSDYEVIDDAPDSMDGEELDELDAEIARELAEIDDL